MLRLTPVLGNSQRLDGGSMYGNCPRAVWERWSKPDELGRIELACRALLIETDDRRILLETGIGAFFEPKLKERFGVVEEDHRLLANLRSKGIDPDSIDCVVLSHLHFDHAGGLLSAWKEDKSPELLFPNAKVVVGEQAWERALQPHARDRASFIPALNKMLQESGRLHVSKGDDAELLLGEGFRFHLSDGHSPGLLLTEVPSASGPLLFASDLIPGAPWVHLPITMGYDRFPEQLIDEKRRILGDLHERAGGLCFTHDPALAFGLLQRDERGRYSVEALEI